MKIKNQLNLIVVTTMVVLVCCVILSLWSKNETDKINKQDEVVRELNLYFAQGNQIRDEYFITRSERAKQQWFAIAKKINAQLNHVELMFPGQDHKKNLLQIINLQNNIASFFDQLIVHDTKYKDQEASPEIRELVISQIIGCSHLLYLESSKLTRTLNQKSDEQMAYYNLLTTLSLVSLGLVIIFFSVLLKRRVTRPLMQLMEGTRIIAGGTFDYKLGMVSSDEIGELAGDFNRMTEQLATITVSRDVLVAEMEKRTRTEEALRINEVELEEAQYLANIGSWTYDPVVRMSAWSKGMYRIYGLDPARGLIPFADLRNYIHPDDFQRLDASLKEAVEHGIPYNLELRIQCPDGREKTIISICEPQCDAAGNVVKLRGTTQDITERKLADEKLREGEESLRFFFEYAPVALALFDCSMRYLHVSQRWRNDYGLVGRDLVGQSHYEVFPEITEKWKEVHQRGLAGEVLREAEDLFVRADGSRQWICWEIRPWYTVNGSVGGIVIFAEDISGRKRAEDEKQELEQQFQHTQKLESLGVLAGGIAHDFNNILAIIMGNCSLAKMDEKNTATFIPEIEKASERAAELCRQMLAYAGKAQFVQANVDFGSLVAETVNMLKKTVPQNAVITFDRSTHIPCVQGDASQLSQITMNLIINASEAIGNEQGDIRVTVARATISADQSNKDYHGKIIPPGDYVCLEVIDNGCGMDEEAKWRIFEPFYTTKFTGRGLGMSAVLGIIMSHKGALQLDSQLGQGTTFRVYLPARNRDGAKDEPVCQEPQQPWQGSGTILLAEDDDQIRHIAKTLLQMFGFTVLEAVDGQEALGVYREHAADITLVVTDMGMPVMDGYALFHALKNLAPALPVIISSGFGDGEVTSRIHPDDIAGLICKPYTPEKLRDVLKSVLEKP